MKKVLLLAALLAVAWFFYFNREPPALPAPPAAEEWQGVTEATFDLAAIVESDNTIAEAFASRASGFQVVGGGTVDRLLDDDAEGGRHQRFILRLDSGQTLLVAHNIDLAPRIDSLQAGDTVTFNGVYEWNERGGVIHWTHHDPQGEHEAGWIRHRNRTYQ